MAYPNYAETKEEWWRFVDENWHQLFEIMRRFLPFDGYEGIDQELLPHLLSVEVERLKVNHDPKLAGYFQAAWGTAPDSPSIHYIPKWNILCDLCSEEYVLE